MPIRKREVDEKALMEKQWRSLKIADGSRIVRWIIKDGQLYQYGGRIPLLKRIKPEKS